MHHAWRAVHAVIVGSCPANSARCAFVAVAVAAFGAFADRSQTILTSKQFLSV